MAEADRVDREFDARELGDVRNEGDGENLEPGAAVCIYEMVILKAGGRDGQREGKERRGENLRVRIRNGKK